MGVFSDVLLKPKVNDFTLVHLDASIDRSQHLSSVALKTINVYLVLFADFLEEQSCIVKTKIFINGEV